MRTLIAVDAIALILILGGWLGVSGDAIEQRQLSWLTLCVGGLVLSGVAHGTWVLGGRKVIIVARAAVLPAASAWVTAGDPSSLAAVRDDQLRTSGPNMRLFHLPDCPLAVGKDAGTASRPQFLAAGLKPCEVCQA